MALEIKYSKNTSDDGEDLILTNDTGAYDVTDNPTGFGGPNLERAEVNIIAYVTFGSSNGTQIFPTNYTPDVDDTITFNLQGDGVYEITVYALPTSFSYSGATQAQLEANAVSKYEFTPGHLQTLFAARQIEELYEVVESDECKNKQRFYDEIFYIFLQVWGAQTKVCNDQADQAHYILTELTERIQKSRI